MPTSTFVEIPQEEHAQMRASLRRARYGYLLALHILVWCADGRTPTAIAAVLFGSRSSVDRTVRASREGTLGLEHDAQGRLVPPVHTTVLLPTRRRSLLALLKAPPRASGWCRTRWSCATLAATLQATRGIVIAAETMRRWLHALGWVWKRAKLVAKAADPHRVDRLARIRLVYEQLRLWEAKAVEQWLAQHPRLTLLLLPTYGPRANPIERAFGDVHDLCTRHHTRKRLRDLVADVEAHLHVNGPWKYKLSEIYYAPAVTAAVENMAAEAHSKTAA
jgi:transposase